MENRKIGRNIFQPINVLHHFLKVFSPAGKIFKIQAIGETINKAHKIGILISVKIRAVKMLNKKVAARTKANISEIKAPKVALSTALAVKVVWPGFGSNNEGFSVCPNRPPHITD